MPVEVESSGQVSEVMRVLRRRAAWILLPFALITSLGTAFAVVVPKKYVCRTRVMVHDVPGAGSGTTEGREQGKVATHLIKSPKKVQGVIVQDLGWPFQQLSDAEREDLIEKVLGNLKVETPNMGLGVKQQVVSISYADTDRHRAFEFLGAMSERWRGEVLESTRVAKQAEFANLTNRKKQMEARVKKIGEDIARLNKNNDIPPWTPNQRGERPLDPAFGRLEELRTLHADLRLEIDDDELDLAEMQQRYELMDDEVPFEQTAEGSDYTEEITTREEAILSLRFEIDAKGYKPSHTRYRDIQDQIRQHEEVIRLLRETSTSTTTDTDMVPNQEKLKLESELQDAVIAIERKAARYDELGTEIANTEARTKELQSVYQQLETLNSERARLNQNLVTIGDDHNAMRREIDYLTSAAGNPFTILDEPKMPVRPTEPDPVLIIIFSVLASLALGLGVALALEYSRSCFRSVNDITRVMVVPVLGTLNDIVTRRDRRRALIARTLVGGTTVAFVVVVGVVTWAWAVRPDLLGDDLRQSIDAFRASFE